VPREQAEAQAVAEVLGHIETRAAP
jgi:hypothetical protein